MTLIPSSVININQGAQNINSRKEYILNFLKTSLDENQINYFTYCINRLNAFRAKTAENYKTKSKSPIDRDMIEVEEVAYTEREIKSFIVIENSSLFSPIEYKILYEEYTEDKKELKQVI